MHDSTHGGPHRCLGKPVGDEQHIDLAACVEITACNRPHHYCGPDPNACIETARKTLCQLHQGCLLAAAGSDDASDRPRYLPAC
jgi:hypothetical protein